MLVLFILFCASCEEKSTDRYCEAIELLSKEGISIYASYNGLYRLTKEKSEWEMIIEDVQGHMPQEVTIQNGNVFFFDINDYTIKRINIDIPSDCVNELEIGNVPNVISVSRNLENIAYSSDKTVFCYEREKISQFKFPSTVQSIAWAYDNKLLFVSSNNEILAINLENATMDKIANGTWIFVLSESLIGYFDIKRSSCYRKDLASEKEVLVQKMNQDVVAIDWSNNGKYIIASKRQKNGLFQWTVELELYDIDNRKKYILPQFITYTGCVFFTEN